MAAKTPRDCYRHAMRRARERYDSWFTFDDLERMGRGIRQGKAKHLLNESHSRSHWLVDDMYIVVYNNQLRAITTFLPPENIYSYLMEA